MPKKNTTSQQIVPTIEDARAMSDAMMAVNKALEHAGRVSRALRHDARTVGDPAFTAAAAKLLAIVEGMKTGPNVAAWQYIRTLEGGARSAFDTLYAAEQAAKSGQ